MTATTVVLADTHGLFRDGLRAMLSADGAYDVVGGSDDGRATVQLALRHRPALVLLDTFLRGLDGIEATRRIASRLPETHLVVVTARHESRKHDEVFAAGALGYVLKQSGFDVLRKGMLAVLHGRRFVDPLVDGLPSANGGRGQVLSGREREVAQLFAEGYSTRQIAERLCISMKTVGTHREHIVRKLGVRNVAGMTRYAVREGLVSSDE